MFRPILLGTVAIAGAIGVVPGGVAIAQSETAAERAAITVVVPRPRQTDRTYTGIPVETLTAQSVVYIDDVDLTGPGAKSELENRVKAAAKKTCDWLDELYPLAEPDNAECVNQAVKTATPQIDDALAMTR